MNLRWGRREVGLAHDASTDLPDDGSLGRLWLAADPAPAEIAEAAKAAFTRHRPVATVLPVVLDVRASAPDEAEAGGPTDLLVFGDEQSEVELEVEVDLAGEREVEHRTVTLRCTIRNAEVEPTAVTIESPKADHPMASVRPAHYAATGVPAGPLRVAIEFADPEATPVTTTWFTA